MLVIYELILHLTNAFHKVRYAILNGNILLAQFPLNSQANPDMMQLTILCLALIVE